MRAGGSPHPGLRSQDWHFQPVGDQRQPCQRCEPTWTVAMATPLGKGGGGAGSLSQDN